MLSFVNRNVEIFLRFVILPFHILFSILCSQIYSFRRTLSIDQIVEQERKKTQIEKRLSENLLLNIFPKVIAHKFTRNQNMFQQFENVTVSAVRLVTFIVITL